MKRFYLYITAEERKLLIEGLFAEKNLLRQGKYTDGVDGVLLKIMKFKQKSWH